jgi:hypothetical protein
MAINKKDENKVVARVVAGFCAFATVVLVVVGVVAWMMGASGVTTVNKGLIEEKVYFPPKGSPAFSEAAFPAAQKYAGQQVKDGTMAKAYADDFLKPQLALVGGGKTMSEVSGALAADPTNPMLQQLQGAMFQMSTGRAMFLSAYGGSMQAMMMRNAGAVMLVAAAGLCLVAAMQTMRYKQSS